VQPRRLPRVVLRDHADVFLFDLVRERTHDRVLAATLAVFQQRLLDIVGVLAGERRILAGDADTVVAVAGDTHRRSGRHRALGRIVLLGDRLAAEVCGDVGHVLIRQGRRLRVHREMRALARAIGVQRDHDVLGVLTLEPGHAVVRIGVAIAGHAMTAETRLREVPAASRITRGLGKSRGSQCGRSQ
jgi:hypothetical protein